MKKVLAIVLSLVMVLALATAAFAADATIVNTSATNGAPNPASASSTAIFTMPISYTLTIPEFITVVDYGQTDTTPEQIEIENAYLEEAKSVQVKLADKDEMSNGGTVSYPYTLKAGSTAIDNDDVAFQFDATDADTHAGSLDLTAVLNEKCQVAGNYTDPLTFNVAYIDTP